MHEKNADKLFRLGENMTFGASEKHHTLIADLCDFDAGKRRDALLILKHLISCGDITPPSRGDDSMLSARTWYSFSPYTPSMAVFMAYMSGLGIIGISDEDSVGGIDEFISAGDIMGINTSSGALLRLYLEDTPFKNVYLNHPLEKGVAYVSVHGIPRGRAGFLDSSLLSVIRHNRNVRNAVQTWNLRSLIPNAEVAPDFWNEVTDYSLYYYKNGQPITNGGAMGGSITERHLFFTLAKKVTAKYGRGENTVNFIENGLKIALSPEAKKKLSQSGGVQYEYCVMSALEDALLPEIYTTCCRDGEIAPDALPVRFALNIIRKAGAVPAYCYTGDTPDEAPPEKLIPYLKELGFEAVSYLPSRISGAQLALITRLCDEHGLLRISGESVSLPQHSFVCKVQRGGEFADLADSAWALIGHEAAASEDIENGIYSEKTKAQFKTAAERTAHFKDIGLKLKK